MPAVFWVAAIVMTIVALVFMVQPLLGAGHRKVALATAVVLPIFAAGAYLALGTPTLAGQTTPAAPTGKAMTSAGSRSVGSVGSLVDGLAARLADNPDDGKGWLLLAQSYKHLQRLDEARNAYAKAVALGESDASLDSLSPAVAGAGITGSVSLSAAAASIVKPTDAVFIFARAVGQTGAPVAVVQRSAADWPIRFRLTDAQSMFAGVPLSGFDQVIVTARVTRGGDVTDTLQKLEAQSEAVAVVDGNPVELVIR